MNKTQRILKHLKKEQGQRPLHLLGITLSAVVVLSSAKLAHAAKPMETHPQTIQYDVYAGGIHALKSDLNIKLDRKNERYDLSLTAKTYGLLGKMAPWKGTFETVGWKKGNGYNPEQHKATTTWRGEDEIKAYSYNKDGSFKSYAVTDDKNKGQPRKVDSKLTQGTSDVLTATLSVMQNIAATGKCTGSTDVFDGKRRFKLIFKEKGKVNLTSSRWNVYEGEAVECTAEVKPVAGKWHEKPRGWMSIQEQGRERGTMPTVWFAKIKEGEPAVPVKVRVKTSYGTLFMHMTKYQSGNKVLKHK